MNQQGCVFVVDDEAVALDRFQTIFGSEFEIHTFANADDALQGLRDVPHVDVIISDEHMPGKLGHAFLIEAKEMNPFVQRIITTGLSINTSMISSINEARIFSFIPKPWDRDGLHQLLLKAIEAKRAAFEFHERLRKKVDHWEDEIIADRRDCVALILEQCGFSRIEDTLACLDLTLEHIAKKSKLDWADIDLFETEAEDALRQSLFDRLIGFNSQYTASEELTLQDVRTALRQFVPVQSSGSGIVREESVTILYALAQLAATTSRKDAHLHVSLSEDSLRIEFSSDGRFGFGLLDPLCGYDNETVLKHAWLIHVIAKTLHLNGVFEATPTTSRLGGYVMLPR